MLKTLQPPDWAPPKGYANGIMAEMVGSRLIFVGGQIGWNGQCEFETDDFALQVAQALRNIVAVLAQGGARAEHITRMTWYVKDKAEYVGAYKAIGQHYRDIVGRHFPAMTAVEVADPGRGARKGGDRGHGGGAAGRLIDHQATRARRSGGAGGAGRGIGRRAVAAASPVATVHRKLLIT